MFLSQNIYTCNWHDLHVIYILTNMHQRHVFNSTVKTTFKNGIKNERMLERNYTNILTKLEHDLPFNFEDTGLRSMTWYY